MADSSGLMGRLGRGVSGDLTGRDLYAPPIIHAPLQSVRTEDYASDFYERLAEWITDFDKGLDSEFEVGLRLVSFGQAVTFSLQDMNYYNPYLISFVGTLDDGSPVELVQHVSQISVLLMAVRRPNPEEPKKPLGFRMPERDDDDDDEDDE